MKESRSVIHAIGLMSGTSHDGLDMAFCKFSRRSLGRGGWKYSLLHAKTLPYSIEMKKRLKEATSLSGYSLIALHKAYGRFLGEAVLAFIKKYHLKPDLIASHGHTVFHRPDKGVTFQLGDGAAVAACCRRTVVCDFRSVDVALGGQGAPLVPLGDEILFSDYRFCLNLGGFANVSYRIRNGRIAFDLCPANIVLNALALRCGKDYDDRGTLAASSTVHSALLKSLNALPYYRMQPPKSLGAEWVAAHITPLLTKSNITVSGKLRTFTEHIAMQVGAAVNAVPHKRGDRVLVTGGGAHNDFLVERIRKHCLAEIVVPDKMLVDFKEAIIFAFLGTLRLRGEVNCLRSATGAAADHSGGAVYESG